MIRRIILDNFMAHEHTVIDLAEGLTVLVGPNNCGKSAVIHALEMLCHNDTADYAIRHGAKKAEVTVELNDDDGTPHIITWWRKPNTAGYVIDGREISGIGRGNIPDDLHRYLRMPAIHLAGGEDILLHFGLQKKPIFLIEEGPTSRQAQFFASSTDANKLVQMQKLHQQKTLESKKAKTKLDEDILKLDLQLESLASLGQFEQPLQALEAEHRELESDARQLAAMKQVADELSRQSDRVLRDKENLAALSPLPSPPSLHDTAPLAEQIQRMVRALHQADFAACRICELQILADPPTMTPIDALEELCQRMDQAHRRIARQQARMAATADLLSPPEITDLASLASGITQMEQAISQVQLKFDANDKAKRKLDLSRQEIERFVRENPRCQACGQEISVEVITAGGHAHG